MYAFIFLAAYRDQKAHALMLRVSIWQQRSSEFRRMGDIALEQQMIEHQRAQHRLAKFFQKLFWGSVKAKPPPPPRPSIRSLCNLLQRGLEYWRAQSTTEQLIKHRAADRIHALLVAYLISEESRPWPGIPLSSS